MEMIWLLGASVFGLILVMRDWQRERLLQTALRLLRGYRAQPTPVAIAVSEDADAGE